MIARAAVLALLLAISGGCENGLASSRVDAGRGTDAGPQVDAALEGEDAAAFDATFVYVDASWDAGPPVSPDASAPGVGPDECPAAPPHASPSADLPPDPGPVVRFTVRPYYTVAPDGVTVRDAVLTGDVLMGGVWLVPLGDTLVADSFQKNADNRLCEWIELPTWSVDDPSCAIERGAIRNPFLLRARTLHLGDLTLRSTIDGVASNVLAVRVVP